MLLNVIHRGSNRAIVEGDKVLDAAQVSNKVCNRVTELESGGPRIFTGEEVLQADAIQDKHNHALRGEYAEVVERYFTIQSTLIRDSDYELEQLRAGTADHHNVVRFTVGYLQVVSGYSSASWNGNLEGDLLLVLWVICIRDPDDRVMDTIVVLGTSIHLTEICLCFKLRVVIVLICDIDVVDVWRCTSAWGTKIFHLYSQREPMGHFRVYDSRSTDDSRTWVNAERQLQVGESKAESSSLFESMSASVALALLMDVEAGMLSGITTTAPLLSVNTGLLSL